MIPKPTFYISELDPGNFQLFLHLYVDEDFPEKAVSLAEQIYTVSGFEDSCYTEISIYLIDEVNENLERARIFFKKDLSGSYDREDFYYIFEGGRLDKYKAKFEQLITNSESFSNFK